jgi:hypothetical protein
MPVGGYYLEVQGADELKRALQGTARGVKDLSRAHRAIGQLAAEAARADAPVGSGSRKDGRGHAPPGFLRSRISGGGGAAGAYVQAVTEPFHYLYVQEFGGTSFWHSSGAGALRAANPGHIANQDAASKAGIRGHRIYRKPRNRLGYFIWNVAYRKRREIASEYTMHLKQIAAANGLELEMALGQDIGLEPEPAPGR